MAWGVWLAVSSCSSRKAMVSCSCSGGGSGYRRAVSDSNKRKRTMATLWAPRVSYDSVQVGDELPILVKHESQETIDLYARFAQTSPAGSGSHHPHTPSEFAERASLGA